MKLRDYQQSAVDAVLADKASGNPVLVLATGAGKSLVIAEIANRLQKNILILQPTKEILEQNLEKLLQNIPREEIGVYSASMGEKTIGKYTLATIQSIYTKPQDFKGIGLVIIDECDGLNPTDTGTMFMGFIEAIGSPKVIGLTATPYRQSLVWINWGTDMAEQVTTTKIITRMKGQRESMFWSRILCNVTMKQLMDEGYLCRPQYFNNSSRRHDEIPMNKSQSEFDLEAYETLVQSEEHRVLDAVARAMAISKSVLVFCLSVEQAHRFAEVVKNSAVVSSKTTAKERKRIVDGFKSGAIKTVFNVNVFQAGFDHPALDCIITTAPTNSIRRWVQMCGRGVRKAEGKDHCKIIDFSGNLKRFGRVEEIQIVQRGNVWELESETKRNWHGAILKYRN